MINGHGNNIYQYENGKIKIDFSSNIAFNNKANIILEYLQEELSCIKNYPDPNASKLSNMLAQHHSVKSGNILVTNGSAEAFYIFAHWLSKNFKNICKSLIFAPTFSEYEDSCSLFEHEIDFTNFESFSTINFSSYNAVWLCSPNNPTGYRIQLEDIERACKNNLHTYFLIDKAYNELSENREYEKNLPENLILIHSLTKSFGIPGIRLGYVIANEKNIATLNTMHAPWTVNALAIKAGEFIIENYALLSLNHNELMEEAKFLQEEINKIPTFEVLPSSCNFFLCKITDTIDKNVQELSAYLIEEHGILIRDASNFRTLNNKYFRLATQTRTENLQLIEALKSWK